MFQITMLAPVILLGRMVPVPAATVVNCYVARRDRVGIRTGGAGRSQTRRCQIAQIARQRQIGVNLNELVLLAMVTKTASAGRPLPSPQSNRAYLSHPLRDKQEHP